jgi:hypothetical protein
MIGIFTTLSTKDFVLQGSSASLAVFNKEEEEEEEIGVDDVDVELFGAEFLSV